MKRLRRSIVLVVLSFITIFILTKINKKNPSILLTSSTTAYLNPLREELIQEEKMIWQLLEKDHKCSFEDFKKFTKEWLSDFQNEEATIIQEDERTISQGTSNFIHSIMFDFDIDKNRINIHSWKDKSAAAAINSVIFINESTLNTLPLKAKKFIIAHELQHIINQDPLTNYVLHRMINSEQQKLSQSHPLNRLSRLQEMRADINAALKGPDYAQGYQEFMSLLLKKGENKGISHPKTSFRLSQSKDILQKAYA